jgi:glycosyltransferase involved in cell wall biosynthesis
MVKIGHSYTFFVCNRNFTNKEELDSFKIKGIKVHILDESLFYDANYMSALVLKEEIDVLQYETAQTFLKIGIQVKAKTFIPTALVLHDLEVELLQQLGKDSDSAYLMDYVHYVASNMADSVMTLTKIDQEKRILKHNLPRDKTFVTPIGADASLPYVGPNFDKKIIGFVGNQLYEPNRRAVVYLIEEVLPLVHAKFPDVQVKIIGSSADDLIKMYEGRSDIVFTGMIQNDSEYVKELSSLSLGACLIDAGTGMNVKIANY